MHQHDCSPRAAVWILLAVALGPCGVTPALANGGKAPEIAPQLTNKQWVEYRDRHERRVAQAPHTPGSSGGFCASNGAGAQGIKGGLSLFLVEHFCHIRQSRLDAEASCWEHPNFPDPTGRVTKAVELYYKPNPQCGRIGPLLVMEDATLRAYLGVNNWKAWLRARLPGFLAWLV